MGLTEEELDFLRGHRGGLFDSLQATIEGRKHVTVVEEVHEAAKTVMDDFVLAYPNRMHRLLYLAATAKAATKARDRLLEELLLTMMEWHQSETTGEWGWVPIAPYYLDYLADLVGLSAPTVRAWYDRLRHATWHRLNDKEAANG